MNKPLFKGAGVAITTPFINGEKIDYDAYARQIEFQIQNGTDAIIVCGTTGEASTLSDEERKELIKFTVDKVAHRLPIIAGAGSNNTIHATELAIMVKGCGVDAHLQVTPYYNKTTQKGLIEHYTYIADRVDLPMILYNVPSRTGLNINPETYEVLSKHTNIVAAKEANGNIGDLIKTISLCGDNLDIYSGEDALITPMMSLGAKGVISVISNIMPKQTRDICRTFFDADIRASANLQIQMHEIITAMFTEANPIPVKTAQMLMGMNDGSMRLPLTSITETGMKNLIYVMRKYKLIN